MIFTSCMIIATILCILEGAGAINIGWFWATFAYWFWIPAIIIFLLICYVDHKILGD